MTNHNHPGRRPPGRTVAFGALLVVLLGAFATPTLTAQVHASHPASRPLPRSTTPNTAPDRSDDFPELECGTATGRGCAPKERRVDLERPTFAEPLTITNPLFPASEVGSVIQVGVVEGERFRSETTVLPQTGAVDWYGTQVPVVLVQYVAYLNGRIEEVAIDRYAQADDGSVWYFGEDVIDYQDGAAYFTEGTWLAGRDGSPAMLMPAEPKLGDVYRVENIVGIVFEELTVVEVDKTVRGPRGPVEGAIVVDELGVGGGHSLKTLAPGYGEFLTRNDTELETVAVATPVDSVAGGAPLAVRRALTAAWGTWEYARAEDWEAVDLSVARLRRSADVLLGSAEPFRLKALIRRALSQLDRAARNRNVTATERATALVAESLIDIEARYLPGVEIESARFHAHSIQLRTAAAAGRRGEVVGEVATLERIRDRLDLQPAQADEVDAHLAQLRSAAQSGSLPGAAELAVQLGFLIRSY